MKVVSLGEIATIDRKAVKPEDIVNGTSYVGLENIVSGGAFASVGPVANGELASGKFEFDERHILYGKLRPYLAKIAVPSFSGICSTDILPIRVGSAADKMFVAHFLRQTHIVNQVNGLAAGANLPRISPSALLTIQLPLPPLDEQRRIAAILDKADELRTKRREALAHFDTLTQSIFHSLFGDPIQNERNWKVARLDELGRITTGNTPSRAVDANFGDFIEWIKTDNINIPDAIVGRAAEGLSEIGATKARIVEANSVLMTCIAGSPRVIGNVAIADRRVAFNQQINAFTPREGPIYYWYGLLAGIKRSVQAASRGGMTGLVSKSALAAIMAIDTPLELQQTFATRAAAVERLKELHRKHLAELDALFASLQHRAFKGEL